VVYCERGGRAAAAAAALRRAGFSRILPLQGDMKSWRGSELPCVGC
jgi:rhodanese-related sulfurtransferase